MHTNQKKKWDVIRNVKTPAIGLVSVLVMVLVLVLVLMVVSKPAMVVVITLATDLALEDAHVAHMHKTNFCIRSAFCITLLMYFSLKKDIAWGVKTCERNRPD